MFKTSRLLILGAALAVLLGLGASALEQKAEDMVKDPICGMSFAKSEAKASYEYKGTTYYFCAVGCKDKFAQNPEKYLQKEADKTEKVVKTVKVVKEEKAGCTCSNCQAEGAEKAAACPMMQGGAAMKHGQMAMHHGQMAAKHGEMSMACCPMGGLMQSKDAEFKLENTKDGVQITVSSKNAETVKKIQEHLAKMSAKMKACRESKDCGGDCLDK